MIVYRLAKVKFVTDLSGKGAAKAGGRWNSKGVSVVYTSQSRALCLAELAVHTPLGIVPEGYAVATIDIPEELAVFELKKELLPQGWNAFPFPGNTQEVGDRLLKENRFPVIKVPSAVVPDEFNFLLNPAHPDFSAIRILKVNAFAFDERLFS